MASMLSQSTLARIRNSHIATLNEECFFLRTVVDSSSALGDETSLAVIYCPDPAPPILLSQGYGTDQDINIPCRIQSARAEDIKSLDVSANKRLFWLFLPWWIEDAREQWVTATGVDEFGTQGGKVRINDEDYEIAQIMTTGAQRLMSKMLITQRQSA